ncbi:unnamed protein product [Paramecium pentaurelia]|uniref:Uncharacterized protein n=1 Tax=Paramecium pentaurelia TaxID=43138 RepID=A0A8S1Y9T1_9CILI|nr:unnamed protein product [Paramecium pentaurelia]
MRFHFDPNNVNRIKQQQQDKQQKQPKIELPDSTNVVQNIQSISIELTNENSNMEVHQGNDQQKLLPELNQHIYEPKEQWEKLPDYPLIISELKVPDCNQNEIYLALYEQCFNEEIVKFKEHYSQYKELIFYCDKMQGMMSAFLKKERQMKEKYCQPNQKDLPYHIKKLEYQQQIKEYEKSIEKFIKAQTKIQQIISNDNLQHVSIQMINHISYDQSLNHDIFNQRINEFLEKNQNLKEQLQQRTTQHFVKLLNDSKKMQEENQEIQRQILQLEQNLGKNTDQFQVLNCFI